MSEWAAPPQGWTDLLAAQGFFKVCGEFPDTAIITDKMLEELRQAQATAYLSPYSSTEHWTSDFNGDCECKCLAMRDYCVVGLWRRGELRMVLCNTESGQPHMVLQAFDATDDPWIADPRAMGLVRKSGLPYTWIAREYPGYTLWEKLN